MWLHTADRERNVNALRSHAPGVFLRIMATILITGGSGLIGRALTSALLQQGHQVRWLGRTRHRDTTAPQFLWDVHAGTVDPEALRGVDHVIHLSGAGIADRRWTAERFRELHTSRIEAADLLRRAMEQHGHRPGTFISASGINFHGTRTVEQVFQENDPAFDDPLGRLTEAWEQAALRWQPLCRTVMLRTPMVLAPQGGALQRMAMPVRWGLGAPLGSGRQWITWVHLNDLVRAYLQALHDPAMEGPYLVVAEEQVDARSFMHTIARVLHRPFFLPAVPAFALRLALGRMSSIVLEGSRASNARLLATGFRFEHPRLRPALEDLLQ